MTTRTMRTKALSIWDQGCMRWMQVAVSFTGGKAADRRRCMKHILSSLSVAENAFEVRKNLETCFGCQAIRCPCFQASLSRPEWFSMLHYPLQLICMVISLQWGSQLFSSKSGPEFSRKFWGLGSFTSLSWELQLGCLMCRCLCSRIKLSLCSLAPKIRTGTAQLCGSFVCFRIAYSANCRCHSLPDRQKMSRIYGRVFWHARLWVIRKRQTIATNLGKIGECFNRPMVSVHWNSIMFWIGLDAFTHFTCLKFNVNLIRW